MKVLITGAGGYTGKFLAKHLKERGYSVRGTVRKESDFLDLEKLGVEPVYADINDRESLANGLRGVEKVFHIAGLFRKAGVPASEFDKVNIEGTRVLCELSSQAKIQNIVHCSTVGVHGHIENPPANELTEFNPSDPYQRSKLEGEKLFLDYVKQGKIRGSVIRPAMIYGPSDTRTLKMFKMIANRTFFYVGKGDALVHFVDVRDLVNGFRLASENPDVNGEVFIICGKQAIQLKDLVGMISMLTGVREPWLHLPVKPMQMLGSACEAIFTPLKLNPPIFRRRVDFFTKSRSFDGSKAKLLLGYCPSATLLEELSDIIKSYFDDGSISMRDNLDQPSAILRDLQGSIYGWNEKSSNLYGWSREQVVGKISHKLFSTEFPHSLEKINLELSREGFWRGELTHKAHNGELIKVNSIWKLINLYGAKEPLVLEVNRYTKEKSDLKPESYLTNCSFINLALSFNLCCLRKSLSYT